MSKSIQFEVFGKVQGVFFRKYTKKKADLLNLKGWCKNTARGTVQGEAVGSAQQMPSFVKYLESEGSPKSRIENCDITEVEKLDQTYTSFSIIR